MLSVSFPSFTVCIAKPVTDINRITHVPTANAPEDPAAHVDPRILILSVSPDLSTAYIPVMNSIFSAQKLVRVSLPSRRFVRC